VRSALLNVKGVTRVQVSLENSEAIVTCDRQTAVKALIDAVEGADGPFPYTASVKSSTAQK
jgi:copper chaperone CopZ